MHKALRRYAVENDMHAAEVMRDLLGDFLESKMAGDQAVETAIFRRGFEAGTAAERQRIASAIQPPLGHRRGIPTSPPFPRVGPGTAAPGVVTGT